MCGIVGLFLKDRRLEPELGAMLAPMLVTMTDRGPDSAGFAVYGGGAAGRRKLTLRGTAETDFVTLAERLAAECGEPLTLTGRDTHAVLGIPAGMEERILEALAALAPDVAAIGVGNRIELY